MSNTNYPNLNPQLQNAKGAAINAKDAVVNSKVRGQSAPVRVLSASIRCKDGSCVAHQSAAAAFIDGCFQLCFGICLLNAEATSCLFPIMLTFLSTVIPRS
jgi:hypothetical protein